MKRYLLISALLVSAISAQAALNDSKAEAEACLGEPFLVVHNLYYYHYENWIIIQAYSERGYACITSYSKLEHAPITDDEAASLDRHNLPGVRATDGMMIDSGSDTLTQWSSFDRKYSLLTGTMSLGAAEGWLATRMYVNAQGAKMLTDGSMDWLKKSDTSAKKLNL